MCGILGIVASAGRAPSVTDRQARKLRDLMAHRGPDGAGLWRDRNVVLGHRRLAILDLSDAGAQPMSTPDGRFTIVYNGELYNEPQVRAQLGAEGVRLTTMCDTETVLLALATWGPGALERLRGMYALGLFDRAEQTLLLAVDEFAMKPLHWAMAPAPGGGGPELVFASEIEPVVRHPAMEARPDPVVVSSYLTTIRTTLGDRTMLAGVRVLTPGQRLLFDLRQPGLRWKAWQAPGAAPGPPPVDAGERLREALEGSVRAHLRCDASICMLLSGGLDSAAIAHCAARAGARLDTYCSGAAASGAAGADDFHFARMIAGDVGARHTEAPVSRALFSARWQEMVQRTGQPLSTPNEVAINEVARALRADGHAATLSGEGADELLAGYSEPLRLAAAYLAAGGDDPGLFQLVSCAWVPLEVKADVLQDDVWRAAEQDETLIAHYRDEHAAAAAEPGAGGGESLEAALRFHRRINLTGLLRRLDSATMLASVEGRTPFADREIAALCGAIPMAGKLHLREDAGAQTKIALRRAMAGRLPEPILTRPKASFPLPFEGWLDDLADILRHPGPALDLLRPEAIEALARRPSLHWQRAWPVMNVVLWAKRWWG